MYSSNIALREDQWERLDLLRTDGRTYASMLREAVDMYLDMMEGGRLRNMKQIEILKELEKEYCDRAAGCRAQWRRLERNEERPAASQTANSGTEAGALASESGGAGI